MTTNTHSQLRSKKARRLGILAAAIAFSAVLSGCSSGTSSLESSGPAESAQSSDGPYTVKITDPVNNGWLAVAKRDGVLEDALEPLDVSVEWVPAKGAVSANLPLFSTGEIQVSEGAFTPVVGAASNDAPIRIGAVLDTETAGNSSGIIASTASGADEVADLTGKSIAVNPAGKGEYIVLRALEQSGLSKDDVKLEYLQPSEALAAFTSGKVDAIATFGDFFRQAKESGTVVATEADIDSQDREIILFTDDLLEARADIALAIVEAAGPIIANRSEQPEDYVNVFETSGPRALSGAALDWQVRVNSETPAALRIPNEQDRERLQSIIDIFIANGVIPEGASADALIADLG